MMVYDSFQHNKHSSGRQFYCFCAETKMFCGYRFHDVFSSGQMSWIISKHLLSVWRKTADSGKLICLSERHSTKQMIWQAMHFQLLRVVIEDLNYNDTICIPFSILYIWIIASGISVIILFQPVAQLFSFILGIASRTLKEWSQSHGFKKKKKNRIHLICDSL